LGSELILWTVTAPGANVLNLLLHPYAPPVQTFLNAITALREGRIPALSTLRPSDVQPCTERRGHSSHSAPNISPISPASKSMLEALYDPFNDSELKPDVKPRFKQGALEKLVTSR